MISQPKNRFSPNDVYLARTDIPFFVAHSFMLSNNIVQTGHLKIKRV